jgi:hypothetical protein
MKKLLFAKVTLLIILILILFLCGLVWATLFHWPYGAADADAVFQTWMAPAHNPAAIFLFGSGLLGLVAFGRGKFRRKE